MPLRLLLGPVASDWIEEYLPAEHRAGNCLCLNTQAPADVVVEAGDTWETVVQRLPPDWLPDALVLYLPYRSIPQPLWEAPCPIIGLAGDWNLQWHAYRRLARHCDLLLTDRFGVETLQREGIPHVRPGNLFGLGQSWLDYAWPDGERDIDLLFVGNVHPAVQQERLPWLARLAALRPSWNVVLTSGVFGDDYRRLLARSRIVFNRSIRGEWNCRVAEAIAAGALLFQEANNREVPLLLRDREECVLYDDANLEALLDQFLRDESARQAIAARARRRLAEFTFAAQWQQACSVLTEELPGLRERAVQRTASASTPDLITRTWVQLSCTAGNDSALFEDLRHATRERARDSAASNAAGVLSLQIATPAERPAARLQAAQDFQDAWSKDPRQIVAGLNLAEMLCALGQTANTSEQAHRTLAMLEALESTDRCWLDAPHAPAGFDEFRVEWEKSAWKHAGQPAAEARAKQILVRRRCHQLLAQVQDDLLHTFVAEAQRPDLATSQAALGLALVRHGRLLEAVPYLRTAVARNPFDVDAARALQEALGRIGRIDQQQRLARERRWLSAAASKLVAAEPWFAEPPRLPSPTERVAAVPFRIAWQGSQTALHSLALVNREVCLRLSERGHLLTLQPARYDDPPGTRVPLPPTLQEAWKKMLSTPVDFLISHQWPPDFAPPRDGHWIVFQPWEFGSLPRAWLEPLTQQVDEVWVPSHFVRDGYLQSGLAPEQVHVIPLGVSEVFRQDGHPAYPLSTDRRFKFLFVGGTLERKGIDLLLKAYTQSFSDRDDVCLVIKDMGVGTFYQGQTAVAMIQQFRSVPQAPAIEYLCRELSEPEMASLYAACDCLVHPYRGEGFGLPIAEAMACGLPVIVTGYGAALDFCRADNACLLPARVSRFREKRVGKLETVDFPWWAEPEIDALRLALHRAVEQPEAAQIRGKRGQAFIRAHFTWEHTVAAIEARLEDLRRRPRKRQRYQPASPPPPAPRGAPAIAVPASTTPVHSPGARPRVSLCMIVKNEEANLPDCLQSVADLVDEIVIVDTGSTDRTKSIAVENRARVVDFPWIDSFSAARNESLRHATGQWIFWMDADDRLDAANRQKLRTLLGQLPEQNIGYVMKCLCLPDADTGTATMVDHVRLFRNHPDIRWTYRIHEQILPAIRRTRGEVRWSDLVIHHVGYQNRAVRQGKLQRDLRLLTLENQEQPDDPFTLFNLASVYQEQGRTAEALTLFRRSRDRSAPEDSIVRKLYAQIAQCHRILGQLPEARQACEEGRRHYPDDLEILSQEALVRQASGDRSGAIACLEHVLQHREGPHFASVDTGLGGYKTRHNLAVFLQQEGRLEDAARQWQLALEQQPQFIPALLGLVELAWIRRDWPAFADGLERLRKTGKADHDVQILIARRHLAQGDFAQARQAIDQAITQQPRAVWPRVVLTHILLQEGKDPVAAEQALRDVLALDPQHAEARRNREILLRQPDGPPGPIVPKEPT